MTSEIVGPPGSGGIGTAMTGLAEHLAATGCPVTILYTGGMTAPDIRLDPWQARYAERGITLVALTIEALRPLAGPVRDEEFGTPYLVYQYLSARSFDVVHFNDYLGDGYVCIAARQLGQAFRDTLLVVALHGPSEWARELNQAPPATGVQPLRDFAERLSVKWAGVLWSPSRYLLDWARRSGFECPVQTLVQQYCLPSPPAATAVPSEARLDRAEPIREIVFFGRLETRKGLPLFCDVIDQLEHTLVDRGISVTFLGKSARCQDVDGLTYLVERAKTWRCAVKAITDLDQPSAVAYLRSGGKLAVMASPADNSPCTVYEALSSGIPFLAANVGGIPELVHPNSHNRVLFTRSTDGLSAALHRALDAGGSIAAPAITQEDTRQRWSTFHRNWQQQIPPVRPPQATGRVVAIVDGMASGDLASTLASLAAIDAIHHVIIVSRASADRVVPDDELATIGTDSVLFIAAGVRVHSDAFAQMLSALTRVDIDGLQAAAETTNGRTVLPLGLDPAFTLAESTTLTGALLVRGPAVMRALRPRNEDHACTRYCDLSPPEGLHIWPYPHRVFVQHTRWRHLYRRRRGQIGVALLLIDLGLSPLIRAGASLRRRIRALRSRQSVYDLDRK